MLPTRISVFENAGEYSRGARVAIVGSRRLSAKHSVCCSHCMQLTTKNEDHTVALRPNVRSTTGLEGVENPRRPSGPRRRRSIRLARLSLVGSRSWGWAATRIVGESRRRGRSALRGRRSRLFRDNNSRNGRAASGVPGRRGGCGLDGSFHRCGLGGSSSLSAIPRPAFRRKVHGGEMRGRGVKEWKV